MAHTVSEISHRLKDEEVALLHKLRLQRKQRSLDTASQLTAGQIIADKVAATMGSWPFIIVQSCILLVWIILNITAFVYHWDPYPFILLNLALSFQAAYAAPFIMMSQNRQSDIDRGNAKNDYDINIKAELEIELLHEKLDTLRQSEITRLIDVVEALSLKLADLANRPG